MSNHFHHPDLGRTELRIYNIPHNHKTDLSNLTPGISALIEQTRRDQHGRVPTEGYHVPPSRQTRRLEVRRLNSQRSGQGVSIQATFFKWKKENKT